MWFARHFHNVSPEAEPNGFLLICGSAETRGRACANPTYSIGGGKAGIAKERIEPELVAAATNQGQFAVIHNTKATLSKMLLEGLTHS